MIFGRRVTRRTRGRFQTKVFNHGVEAAIQIHFRASKVKQYFKEGRALRTETTINDTRDFGIKRRVTAENWDALIDVGHQVNQRLLDHQLDACACAPDATLLERVVLPSVTPDGLPAPGLRFGEPRTMVLLACLCSFQHLFAGLTNRSLRELIAGLIPGYTARQMTYDLRRLRRKGFIQRIPRTQRYELTREDADWPSSSPRPTRGSSTPASPNSTPPSQTRSPNDHRSPPPTAHSKAPSRTKSNRPLSRPENDSFVNPSTA